MSSKLSLETVSALLLDEHQSQYGDSLPPKALFKMLYFADKRFAETDIDVEIPFFWYKYGAVARISNTNVTIANKGSKQRVRCSVDPDDIDVPRPILKQSRKITREILEEYYELGLEGLTDKMYDQAPYEVQRIFRRFDHQLEVARDNQATLASFNNTDHFRETLFDFVEAFPTDEFPAYEDDLYTWYRLVSAALDTEDPDLDHVAELVELFWELFCLELACRENSGLSQEEVAAELGVGNIGTTKEAIRKTLREQRHTRASQEARNDQVAVGAAEALVAPHLEFEVFS